jgi:hypothetical protein
MAAASSLNRIAFAASLRTALIKSRKDSGQIVNLVVACASGIMLSNVQFFLKVIDDNTISRSSRAWKEWK